MNASWPGIENVWPVRCGDQDHAIVRFKAVHLDKKLIQGLLTLVVPAAQPCATVTSDSVNLVDEDNAWSVLFTLLEEVTNTASADADEHFHEVRA